MLTSDIGISVSTGGMHLDRSLEFSGTMASGAVFEQVARPFGIAAGAVSLAGTAPVA